jgi:hypothetical protein
LGSANLGESLLRIETESSTPEIVNAKLINPLTYNIIPLTTKGRKFIGNIDKERTNVLSDLTHLKLLFSRMNFPAKWRTNVICCRKLRLRVKY